MARIAVVIGSNRPKRICPEIAEWVRATAERGSSLTFELLDLGAVALPFLDEPAMAALGEYVHEHTRGWSGLVSSYDGFVFVFPQYNWGYPAVLQNALDYLYAEWRDKPAALVTYGTRARNWTATAGSSTSRRPSHCSSPTSPLWQASWRSLSLRQGRSARMTLAIVR